MNLWSSATSTLSECCFLRFFRLSSKRSGNASAIAISLTLPSVLRAWSAAPEPRPPQPINAIFSVSLPAACAPRSTDNPPSRAPPATTVEVFLRKSRRVLCAGEVGWFDSFIAISIDSVDRFDPNIFAAIPAPQMDWDRGKLPLSQGTCPTLLQATATEVTRWIIRPPRIVRLVISAATGLASGLVLLHAAVPVLEHFFRRRN